MNVPVPPVSPLIAQAVGAHAIRLRSSDDHVTVLISPFNRMFVTR